MIELSLNQINVQSPYEVSYAPNGDFVFATNLGIRFYAEIIVENRNPMLQAIIDDFEQTAQVLTAGKPQ